MRHAGLCTRRIVDLRLLGASVVCLLLGSLIYILVRAEPVWFVPPSLHSPFVVPAWVRDVAAVLPTAVHVIALSLATAALLQPHSAGSTFLIAYAWAFVNIAFEIGQHPDFSPHLVAALSAGLDRLWLLDRVPRYFAEGSFDFLDIVAALVGALAARLLIASLTEDPRHAH